jgi:hypothetical protein
MYICKHIYAYMHMHSSTARVFNAGLLARSQFASGKSCDRPTQSKFTVVFLGLRENAELVPKFHVALHTSHAALPMVTRRQLELKIRNMNWLINRKS